MAYVYVDNITTRSATIYILDLAAPANTYSNFGFTIKLNGINAVRYSCTSSDTSYGMGVTFSNEYYLGYNWFVPDSTYTVYATATYGGITYSLSPVSFTTDSASAPSGTISPSIYTRIREQNYDSCVAMSLATAMDRFKAMAVGYDYEEYSTAYIYGSPNYLSSNLNIINNCMTYGSPRWDLVSTNFYTDDRYITDAQNVFNNASLQVTSNAILQRLTGYENIDFYDTYSVANYVQTYGYFMFNFKVPNNFYNVGWDGIVPQPDSYSNILHAISIIGLTTKNSKPHWIAQNSWGSFWGYGGICYIPWDWGIGCDPPSCEYGNPSSWTIACYAVYNNATSTTTSAPTNLTAVPISGTFSATLSWNSSLSSAMYTVLASRDYDNWYLHGTTTNKTIQCDFDYEGTVYVKVMASVMDVYSAYSNVVRVVVGSNRPDYFNWTYAGCDSYSNPISGTSKVSGYGYYVDHQEWNNLITNIANVYSYKGWILSGYPMTTVNTNDTFTATIFNQVKNCIGSKNSTGISDKYLGNDINASDLNILKEKLNGIE